MKPEYQNCESGGEPLREQKNLKEERTRANKRETGSRYEQEAALYLKNQGLTILEQNFHSREGEIDLIARDGRYLVFVEVKYRKNAAKGDPAEAVDYYKQRHIRRTAQYYLYSHRYGEDTPCRFDVISILGSDIRWIKNAFE